MYNYSIIQSTIDSDGKRTNVTLSRLFETEAEAITAAIKHGKATGHKYLSADVVAQSIGGSTFHQSGCSMGNYCHVARTYNMFEL
tara:strand:+ start:125 stop:379 length:255 start_codon:yes stop_codon:yes gene_type:complete